VPTPDDADRLATLERAVAELQREVRDLRADLRAARPAPPAGAPVPAPAPAAPTPRPPASPSPASPPPGLAAPRPARTTLGARATAYARAQVAGLGLPIGAGGEAPDVEALVGRYGTVVVAALLILTGVGAFLTWAVNTFTITPPARVAMGVVLAAAMAAVGWRLRTRTTTPRPALDGDIDTETAAAAGEGTRRFGDVLLALALAVTHVNAWAAGPYLGLVAPAAALAVAALASAALAVLAWRARQQALFVVGVGGALVAPVVTGNATDQPLTLFAYGLVVLAGGVLCLPRDAELASHWRVAGRLLALGGAGYTIALLDDVLGGDAVPTLAAAATHAAWHRPLPVVFPLTAAVIPLLLARRRGTMGAARSLVGGLALAYAAAAAGAALTVAVDVDAADSRLVVLALLTTLGAYAAVAILEHRDTTAPDRRVWLVGALLRVTTVTTALVLPLVTLAAALVALHEIVGGRGAATAALWAAVAAGGAWWSRQRAVADGRRSADQRPPGRRRTRQRARAGAPAVGARRGARVAARRARGRHRPAVPVGAPPAHAPRAGRGRQRGGGLGGGAARRPPGLRLRPVPHPRVARRGPHGGCLVPRRPNDVAGGGRRVLAHRPPAGGLGRHHGGAALGRQEFAEAVSADVSTFLLIGYFAVAGIGAIALGRARRVPAARQVGLALALYAALKAFVEASALDAVGLRWGATCWWAASCSPSGYWYRAAGARPPACARGDARRRRGAASGPRSAPARRGLNAPRAWPRARGVAARVPHRARASPGGTPVRSRPRDPPARPTTRPRPAPAPEAPSHRPLPADPRRRPARPTRARQLPALVRTPPDRVRATTNG
jgi:hypothetical protein